MASDKAVSFHQKVSRLLDKASLHEAFALLKGRITSGTDHKLPDTLHRLEDTYRYMIHYLVEGYDDNGRPTLLADITEQLRMINDALERGRIMADSPDIYSSTLRLLNLRKQSLGDLLSKYIAAAAKAQLAIGSPDAIHVTKEADEALNDLFSHVWTMFGAAPEDYRLLDKALSDNVYPSEMKAQIISGLLLGNLSYYDRNALTLLIDTYEADNDERLSARALTAIMLILAAHPERVRNDPGIRARLTLWNDSIITYRRMREVLMNIIRSRDTQRISSKMQNEVIPELMKLRPEILGKLKNITRDADMEMLEANPEWEEILNKNGLGDKLKELTEMQMDGGDVMMMAFSNLKSYPFFNNAGNWFLPFSRNHSDVLSQGDEMLECFSFLLDMGGMMCDSDKYSFALSLSRMPESQRKTIASQMDAQMSQLKEALADKNLKSSLPEFDAEVTRYVRDIYRFFKLFRRKDDFHDPFIRPIDFMNIPFVAEILEDNEIMNLVGEFYFKRGYYAEALSILYVMEKNNPADPLLWEKIGYCLNSLNRLEEAVVWYKKAELLNPESQWLIKKLALCNRLLNKFEEASEYYEKALRHSPDSHSLLMSSGNCLLESGKTAGALSQFYHADYVRPGNISTLRAIAWGELINSNYSKSIEYYNRIATMPDVSSSDLVNCGHAHILSGNRKKGVDCYEKSINMPGGSIEQFEKEMAADANILSDRGIPADEIRLLADKVRYDING